MQIDTRNEPELALRVGEAMRIRAGLPTAGVYLEYRGPLKKKELGQLPDPLGKVSIERFSIFDPNNRLRIQQPTFPGRGAADIRPKDCLGVGRSSTAPAEPMKSLYSTDFTHKDWRRCLGGRLWCYGDETRPSSQEGMDLADVGCRCSEGAKTV
ncbi:hypothetical protein AK812_SmicGene22276 [Symbiodinium microadriaticum]|uniref:Uncharacterized protein n=1 Tax=Symbiodinium microadriaticum TaxID=2951 RepID=A0A1Q9DKA9_SYMMI|nr:hypothetical protein AK812_SmicGene22276 [Symbiodinium microadriaticum]